MDLRDRRNTAEHHKPDANPNSASNNKQGGVGSAEKLDGPGDGSEHNNIHFRD